MDANALVKKLEEQVAENQTLHKKLAKTLERLEQANTRIEQMDTPLETIFTSRA